MTEQARARTETTFFNGAGLLRVEVALDRSIAWLELNAPSNPRVVEGFGSVHVHLGGNWQDMRRELQRIIDQCEAARAALLAGFEDGSAAPAVVGLADAGGDDYGLDKAIEDLGRTIDRIETVTIKPEMFVTVLADAVQHPAGSFPMDSLPPLKCSCPRNHGGRSETDPLCPLHAGDARD
jgi:hypothetical protein